MAGDQATDSRPTNSCGGGGGRLGCKHMAIEDGDKSQTDGMQVHS